MNHAAETTQKHDGRNVKRIREILQVKQSTLAHALGEEWNQKKVSQLEDKEVIDDKLLEEIAGILKVPVEAIRNFDEDMAVNIISNTFNNNSHDSSSFYSSAINYQPTFNPIDKIVELYEALVKSEKEKVEMLQQILKEKK